jgi:intracellular septation protein A
MHGAAPATGIRGVLAALRPMLLDMLTPVAGFYVLHVLLGVDPVPALTAGALAAGVRTGYRAVRERRVNAFSVMMLLLLAVTVLLVLVTGDGRLILAKSAVVPAVGGLYGIVTTVVGRALLYDVAQPFVTRGDPELAAAWERCWRDEPAFARRLRLLNLIWGIGFVVSAVLRVVVIYRVPLDVAVLAGQAPTLGMLLVLAVITRQLGPPLPRATRRRAATTRQAERRDARTPQHVGAQK